MEKPAFLSVGVAAYNEKESIEEMLESVFKNSLWKAIPADKRELIVCANGCTDRSQTADVVRRIQKEHPEVKLIETRKKGNAFAKNLLARRMNDRADVFFFFDADVLLRTNVMEILYKTLKTNKRIDVAAAEYLAYEKFVPKEKRRLVEEFSVSYHEAKLKGEPQPKIGGFGHAIRRDVIRKIHFPEQLQGNVDSYLTLKVGGDRVARVKEALVIVKYPTSLRDYKNKMLRQFVSIKQLKEFFPTEKLPVPTWRSKKRIRLFRKLPLNEKLVALALQGAKGIAKIESMLALRKLRKGRKVDVWKKITSSKLHRRRK